MFSFFKRKSLLPQDVQDAVAATIAAVERQSTGEIRVFVESHCSLVNPIERCEELFVQLHMHETLARNGVLLYLALKDKQFAMVGDKGINEKVGGNQYWQKNATLLQHHLSRGEFKEGICNCVLEMGSSLAKHFPDTGLENKNELPDEIVFGK